MGRVFIVAALGFVGILLMAIALHGTDQQVLAAIKAPTGTPTPTASIQNAGPGATSTVQSL